MTEMKLLGFDIETSRIPSKMAVDPTGKMAEDGSPVMVEVIDNDFDRGALEVYCAALTPYANGKRGESITFSGRDRTMSVPLLVAMVDAMQEFVDCDYQIVAHNGLSFDMQIIYAMTHDTRLQAMAMHNMIDQCFGAVSAVGYGVGLKAVVAGYGLAGKMEDMDGSKVEEMWRRSPEDDEIVLGYVTQDAWAGVEAVIAHQKAGVFRWISKGGRPMTNYTIGALDTPADAIRYPRPNTSWMSQPINRDATFEWTQ